MYIHSSCVPIMETENKPSLNNSNQHLMSYQKEELFVDFIGWSKDEYQTSNIPLGIAIT